MSDMHGYLTAWHPVIGHDDKCHFCVTKNSYGGWYTCDPKNVMIEGKPVQEGLKGVAQIAIFCAQHSTIWVVVLDVKDSGLANEKECRSIVLSVSEEGE